MKLGCGALREEHDAAHGSIARDGEVRQQEVSLRVARVLNGGDHTDVERAVRHLRIERAGDTVDDLALDRNDAPIDCSVDRVAIDVGDPADAHWLRSHGRSRVFDAAA